MALQSLLAVHVPYCKAGENIPCKAERLPGSWQWCRHGTRASLTQKMAHLLDVISFFTVK